MSRPEATISGAKKAAQQIRQYLPPRLSRPLSALDRLDGWEEIRLRGGRPLAVFSEGTIWYVTGAGEICEVPGEALHIRREDLKETLSLMTGGSVYAREDELSQGYLTLPGGHRVGVVGQVVVQQGKVKRLLHPGGMNIRRCREFLGVAKPLVNQLHSGRQWRNTVIISPPGCGKTTLLRDLVRLISNGIPRQQIRGRSVGLVDERSEVAACHRGIPTFEIGVHTDVVDACPKAEGMLMLLRSMGPEVLATDELGRAEDAVAVREALNGGVSVLTTVHAKDVMEGAQRPHIGPLLRDGSFCRAVTLSRRNGPGTLEEVAHLPVER